MPSCFEPLNLADVADVADVAGPDGEVLPVEAAPEERRVSSLP